MSADGCHCVSTSSAVLLRGALSTCSDPIAIESSSNTFVATRMTKPGTATLAYFTHNRDFLAALDLHKFATSLIGRVHCFGCLIDGTVPRATGRKILSAGEGIIRHAQRRSATRYGTRWWFSGKVIGDSNLESISIHTCDMPSDK